MSTLTPAQEAARKVGMSRGVPEEFAIDCTAIAMMNVTIGQTKYRAGATDVRIFDSRVRDRFRKMKAIMPTEDVFMPSPDQPVVKSK